MIEDEDSEMEAMRRTTQLDFAIESLRNAILNGEVKPGGRVNEVTFTTNMGISRTTFREALRQMEQAGLLVRVPFRGTFVREFSKKEIKELNSLRGVLETYAAEIIIENGENRAEDLGALYEIVAQMKDIHAQEDAAQTNVLHIAFHRVLVDLAGHQLLFTVWNDLAQQFWMAMRVSQLSFIARGEPDNFAEAHREVVDAIAAGNIDRVRGVIRAHVSRG